MIEQTTTLDQLMQTSPILPQVVAGDTIYLHEVEQFHDNYYPPKLRRIKHLFVNP